MRLLFIITVYIITVYIITVCFTRIMYYNFDKKKKFAVIDQTVDEEYVPNTMVPYSKFYHRSCKGLFVKGTLIQPCSNKSNLKICAKNIAEEWKPDGCKLKYYTKEKMTACLKTFSKNGRKSIYFMGDSRVRGVYETMKSKHTGEPVVKMSSNSIYIKEADVTIIYLQSKFVGDDFIKYLTKILENEVRPIFVYLANSVHHIQRDRGENPFKNFFKYEKNLTELMPILNRMSDVTKTIWPLQATVHKDGQIQSSRVPYRVQLVDLYNDVTNKILKPSNVTLIYSIRSLGKATLNSYKDETHLGFKADAIIVEILLNYICNNQWQQTDVQDNDEDICCSKQDKFS